LLIIFASVQGSPFLKDRIEQSHPWYYIIPFFVSDTLSEDTHALTTNWILSAPLPNSWQQNKTVEVDFSSSTDLSSLEPYRSLLQLPN